MAKKNNNTAKRKTNDGPAALPAALQKRNVEEVAGRLAATPITVMRKFSEELDRLFEDFGGRGWLTPMLDKAQLPEGPWSPQVEIFERDNELVLRADLPGLTKDDVNVEIANDGITIEGERRHEHEEKGEGYFRSERSYGKFYRRIPMPEGAKAEDANASFSNGVLEIAVPLAKQEERKRRRLEIRGERHQQARGKAA
ncbi:MAG TPA: Hsp20/alpha crystallin family protein [Pyrinomonadaceae bacterium]|jgi:HSP20 family protein|nr:Hsp20/alpha crystallin family protein [Pyrinomonadaceae bacterium]